MRARNASRHRTVAAADVENPLALLDAIDEEIVIANQPMLGVFSTAMNESALVHDVLEVVLDRKQTRQRPAGVGPARLEHEQALEE